MSKTDAINRLNNSKLKIKGSLRNKDFRANKTPIKVTKEGAFVETHI